MSVQRLSCTSMLRVHMTVHDCTVQYSVGYGRYGTRMRTEETFKIEGNRCGKGKAHGELIGHMGICLEQKNPARHSTLCTKG